MADEVLIRVKGDAKSFNKAMDGVEKRSAAIAEKMGRVGRAMTMGVTLPIVAAGVAAFNMASDLDESISQVGTVFGDEAAGIIAASESMTDSFSQAEFLAMAGNLGDIAQGMGFAREESDDMATSVLTLAQDLGSFKNVPVEQAVQAITASLTGERESLKTLGIVINQAMVDQEALTSGLWDGEEALTAQMKAQATFQLLIADSANAIGDFDRTSEGAANASRIAAANFKDMAATLGTELLPMGTALIAWATDAISWFKKLSPEVKRFVVPVLGVVAAIGPLLIVGAKMAKMWKSVSDSFGELSKVMSINPWVLLAVAVVALVAIIVLNWDTISAYLLKVWDTIKRAASSVFEWINEKFGGIIALLVGLFKISPLGLLIVHFDAVKSAAADVFEVLKTVFTFVWDLLVKLFEKSPLGLLVTHFETVKTVAATVWDAVRTAFGHIVTFFEGLFTNSPVGLLIEHWDAINEAAGKIPEIVETAFKDVLTEIGTWPADISKEALGMWNGIKDAFREALNWVIRKWNDLSFTFPSFTGDWNSRFLPGGEFTVGGWHMSTKNVNPITSFHDGGVFQSGSGRGEGLALLQDGETVIPAGSSGGGVTINVSGFVGNETDLAREIDKLLTRRARLSSLGFV